MSTLFAEMDESGSWRLMVEAAKKGAVKTGFELERVPGRGLSNVWTVKKDGRDQRAAIRTTRDRWFAFQPLRGGSAWKTLDDVDIVIVASVDSREAPMNVEVYIFPAEEVRAKFKAARNGRIGAGKTVRDGYGMWINLDLDQRATASSIGSGLAAEHKPVAVFAIEDLLKSSEGEWSEPVDCNQADVSEASDQPAVNTIAEVLAWARQRVAELSGMKVESVKLDLRFEV